MPTRVKPSPKKGILRFTPRQMSWAAILFEAAQSDKIVKTIEIDQIVDILSREFKLTKSDALSLCERHSRDNRRLRARDIMAKSTKALKISDRKKIQAAIWRVVQCDGLVLPEEEVFVAVTGMSLSA